MYLCKVTSLEARLKTMRKQAATDVEVKEREGRRAAATLEEELASERAQHAAAIEELQNKYQLKEASLREEGTAALRSLEEQLQGEHRAEVHTIREADRIAADALRDKLERDKAAALHKAGERHREDLGTYVHTYIHRTHTHNNSHPSTVLSYAYGVGGWDVCTTCEGVVKDRCGCIHTASHVVKE